MPAISLLFTGDLVLEIHRKIYLTVVQVVEDELAIKQVIEDEPEDISAGGPLSKQRLSTKTLPGCAQDGCAALSQSPLAKQMLLCAFKRICLNPQAGVFEGCVAKKFYV